MRRALLLALPLCLLAAAVWSASGLLEGKARVVDGDTLSIGATKVRLGVVDAPELDQTCAVNGKAHACGAAAKKALSALIAGAPVRCTPRGTDVHGRTLAVCFARKVNLNIALLEGGHAIVATQYLHEWPEYAPAMRNAEANARDARRGIWATHATSPAAHRAATAGSRTAAGAPGPACTIKGNINSKGVRIYHLPGSEHYAKTRISNPGEQWFCTEAGARASGFRAARS